MKERGWGWGFVLVAALVGLLPVRAAGADDPKSFRIGVIDFYGAQGMDTAALRGKISVHGGQVIALDDMEKSLAAIKSEVLAATGMKVTDVEVLCCDVPETWDLYVGLPGSSYKPATYATTPVGEVKLPGEGLALYKQDLDLLMEAIGKGQATEDDSKGYQMTNYPPAQKVQLAMRVYALGHTEEIERVLRESKYAEQRQASAMLLGYSHRSEGQVAALEAATDDEDSEVRNNAVRALEVMLAAGAIPGMSAKPFVAMLYSGAWSDRNKASLLLDRMTMSRDRALLLQLRDALGPLEDGARWHSPGHARPFLDILGRIGGIDEKQLQALEDAGAKDEILAAARKQ
jgi:hypothetical protein